MSHILFFTKKDFLSLSVAQKTISEDFLFVFIIPGKVMCVKIPRGKPLLRRRISHRVTCRSLTPGWKAAHCKQTAVVSVFLSLRCFSKLVSMFTMILRHETWYHSLSHTHSSRWSRTVRMWGHAARLMLVTMAALCERAGSVRLQRRYTWQRSVCRHVEAVQTEWGQTRIQWSRFTAASVSVSRCRCDAFCHKLQQIICSSVRKLKRSAVFKAAVWKICS